jgi:dUTP pyrophosphatase
MEIKIINKSPYQLPTYQTQGSAGMDLSANIDGVLTLQPRERHLVPTGLFIELPIGYEAQIRPRSGMSIKQGITCLNSPGTIDSIQPGERIAQMVIAKYEKAEWVLTEQIDETTRNEGGFGSTGNS